MFRLLLLYVAVPGVLVAAVYQAARNRRRPRDPSTSDGYTTTDRDPTHRAAAGCGLLGGLLFGLMALSTLVDRLP